MLAKAPLTAVRFLHTLPGPLVSVDWLADNIHNKGVKVVDASMPAGPNAIPGARHFDIDAACDTSSTLPHMLPSPEVFADHVAGAGVTAGDAVVVYHDASSPCGPRLSWMFEVFGWPRGQVAVLDGGLEAWVAQGHAVSSHEPPAAPAPQRFQASWPTRSQVANLQDIIEELHDHSGAVVLDARSSARFAGAAPEPRPLPSGHMPGSANLPFPDLMTQDGTMKPVPELRAAFDSAGIAGKVVYSSCGSGITACVLWLGHRLAYPEADSVRVFDGSWTEWAIRVLEPQLAAFRAALAEVQGMDDVKALALDAPYQAAATVAKDPTVEASAPTLAAAARRIVTTPL